MSEALYRKYRPQVFTDVVGQDPLVVTLQNAITQNKVSHAYLFCGPRGTGKTTMARLLAKALLCETAPTANPDGTCEDCKMIAAGRHPDVYELDAASRTGVENVREEIIGRVQFAPTRGAKKIYIIDEVHMLSTAAFNALLKTLEEPPDHVVFVLCTTDPQKVPETIHSRCQRFDFKRIGLEGMVAKLGAVCVLEDCAFEGEALELIAHRADGGMRNAFTSLEQLMAFSNKNITLEAAEDMLGGLHTSDISEFAVAVGKRDVPACFAWIENFIEAGGDVSQFAYDFSEYIRNLYVLQIGGASTLEVSEAMRNQMSEHVTYFGTDRLLHDLCILGDVISELKTSTNARLSFEIAAVRMARPTCDLTLESLAERVERLEREACQLSRGQASSVSSRVENKTIPENSQPSYGCVASSSDIKERDVLTDASVQKEKENRQQAKSVPEQDSAITSSEQDGAITSQSTGPWGRAVENPAALQRTWQQIMSALKRVNQPYSVMFLNARAVYVPAKQVVEVQFPPNAAFTYKAANKPEVIASLNQAISETLGVNAPFEFVRMTEQSMSTQQKSSQIEQKPTQQPNRQPAQQEQQFTQAASQTVQPVPQPEDSYYDNPPIDQYPESQSSWQPNQDTSSAPVQVEDVPPQTEEQLTPSAEQTPQNEPTDNPDEAWRQNLQNAFGDISIKKV